MDCHKYNKELLTLCTATPFDAQKVNDYIKDNSLSGEDVTRVALKLADDCSLCRSDFLYDNNREPLPQELPIYNLETIFNIFIENGLDPNLVVCDDGITYLNILEELFFIDYKDLGARILRNILNKGGNPNVLIDGVPLFEIKDSDFILDIEMDLYSDKQAEACAFRYWLVLIGFGGVLADGKPPVDMCGDYKTEIFKNFERFDYITKNKGQIISIIDKETNKIIASA